MSVVGGWLTVRKLNSVYLLADGRVELARGRNDVTPYTKTLHVNDPWPTATPLDKTDMHVAVPFALDFDRSGREPAFPKATQFRVRAHDLGDPVFVRSIIPVEMMSERSFLHPT